VFPEPQFEARGEADEDAIDSSKVYKVSYKINMLPMLGEYVSNDENGNSILENEGESLMEICTDAEDKYKELIDIFETENFI